MCGRFNISDSKEVTELITRLGADPDHLREAYNIAPTANIPVVIQTGAKRAVHGMRWWLTPSWAKEISTQYSMFNARCETINTSRAFKGPFRHHRGIVPASSFIEWRTENGRKQPYMIRAKAGALALGCIWDVWERAEAYIESCALITRESPPFFTSIHHRFPFIVPESAYDLWLDERSDIQSLLSLFEKYEEAWYEVAALDPKVNNARLTGQEAETPIGEMIEYTLGS